MLLLFAPFSFLGQSTNQESGAQSTTLNFSWGYLCNTEVATLCTANLEALGPVKHDLYESLMAWERAPAKRINELFSAEWEALTFGHSQGDRIRHQARSLKLKSVLNFQMEVYFLYFSICLKGQCQECYQHLKTIIELLWYSTSFEDTWEEGQRIKSFGLVFISNALIIWQLQI